MENMITINEDGQTSINKSIIAHYDQAQIGDDDKQINE